MQLYVCGILLSACLVALVLFVSLCALVTGLLGLAVRMHKRGNGRRRLLWGSAGLAMAGAVILVLVGSPVWRFLRSLPAFNTTTMDAEALRPFISAMDEVDRASLGFTDIPPDAVVRIERAISPVSGYDVMLHVYAATSRTIAFKRDDGSYTWIGEQEIHTGPGEYQTADGVDEEHISITYNTVDTFGAPLPLNTVHVNYEGDDPRLWRNSDLTLADVAPILEEWRALRTPVPGSSP